MGGWFMWIYFLTLVYTAETKVGSIVTHTQYTQLHSQPNILPPQAPSTNTQTWPDNDDFGIFSWWQTLQVYILYSLPLFTE
jgi:hypothetical protein